MFSKKPLDKQIQEHLRKLQKEIIKKHSQFTVQENYEVKKNPGTNFSLDGGGLLYNEAKAKSEKIRFLQEVSELLAIGELTPEKLNNLLSTYPRANEGIFSKTNSIIKLIRQEINKGITLDCLDNCQNDNRSP